MKDILKLAAIGFIIVVFFISLHYLGWLNPVEGWLLKALEPAQRVSYNTSQGFRSFYSSWLTKRDLLSENSQLVNELQGQRVTQAQIYGLEEENNLLKRELEFIEGSQSEFLSAKIITGVSDEVSRSVIINRGSKDGVIKDLAVVVDRGVMIGKISEIYDYSSKVLLLTDNRSRVAATIQNQDKTAGLVEGQFGLSMTMVNIPQDQEIEEGDLIVTSGLEGDIPRGLLIARVEGVSSVESEIFKAAMLSSIASLSDLNYVLVVLP
jgi:rod shape-determining protein MreC